MSTKTTIMWLLVAMALGAAALLLLRTSKSADGAGVPRVGESVFVFDPAALTGLRIEHPGGDSENVQRESSAEWTMQVRLAGAAVGGGEDSPRWPVSPTRIDSLTRLMLDAKVRSVPARDASMDDRPTVVRLRMTSGGEMVVRLSGRSVGGTALVEVEGAAGDASAGSGSAGDRPRIVRAMIDDRLHELFRGAAPREWRDRTLAPDIGADVARLRLTNDRGDVVALGRVKGAWTVREPYSAPADAAAVQRLISMLGGLRIADFLDGGLLDDPARFNPPAATVTFEMDRREAGAGESSTVRTEVRGIEIGGKADSSGDRLYARVDKTRVVVIDARAVAELRLDPTLYTWPYPTRVDPSEIGTIVLRGASEAQAAAGVGRVFRRNLDRWRVIGASGQETTATERETAEVGALFAILTGAGGAASNGSPTQEVARPEGRVLAVEPRGYLPMGQVILLSLAGAPLETIEVGSGLAGRIVLRTGAVYREYPVDRVPESLAALIRPIEMPGGPGTTREPDVNK